MIKTKRGKAEKLWRKRFKVLEVTGLVKFRFKSGNNGRMTCSGPSMAHALDGTSILSFKNDMIDEILKAVHETFEKDKYIMSIAHLLDLNVQIKTF